MESRIHTKLVPPFSLLRGIRARSPAVSLAFNVALAGAVASLTACGGGGTDSLGQRVPPVSVPADAPQGASQGALLQSDWATYPRLIRLDHHADPLQNGLILGSVTERVNGLWKPGIHASADQGATFERRTTIEDADFAKGVCCGSMLELSQSVGALAAGTIVYSVSVGHDVAGTFMENRIYVSRDAGRSFQRLEGANCGASTIARVPNQGGTGIWEPEFFIAGDGSLACIYSDETVPGKSQVLKLTKTLDGTHWTAPVVIVQGAESTDRPGMANVVKLPTGRYAMTLETCSIARLDCAVHLKISDDGLNWGALEDMGIRPRTADGKFLRHTPTLKWAALSGSTHGRLMLTGQLVATESKDSDESLTGRVMLVNDNKEGNGSWTMVETPIALAKAPTQSNWCQNYSTALLPSVDGLDVLVWQTDLSADGGCQVRFGQGTAAR